MRARAVLSPPLTLPHPDLRSRRSGPRYPAHLAVEPGERSPLGYGVHRFAYSADAVRYNVVTADGTCVSDPRIVAAHADAGAEARMWVWLDDIAPCACGLTPSASRPASHPAEPGAPRLRLLKEA